MPCIQMKTNVEITPRTEETLKSKLGKAIELLPGKSESWLMFSFEGNSRLYFQGSKEPAAYVDVEIYGKADRSAYNRLTASVTEILEKELSINPSRIYVHYGETEHWGWNGSNF